MNILTASEVQEKYKINRVTLRYYVRKGSIPCTYIGKRMYFVEDQFEDFLRNGGTGKPKEKS